MAAPSLADGLPPSGSFSDTVYAELCRLSSRELAREHDPVTISTAGLVHEAYLKLSGAEGFTDRAHFRAVAARAMRQILTDRARARLAVKRGGGERPLTYVDHLVAGEEVSANVIAVHEALDTLTERDPRLAALVELRFFGGLDVADVADVLGVSTRTATRDWARAKGHLRSIMDAS
ncbi:ECF-type sigma factor [Rubrivirga sp.]|uniref:ECF-type sigma factor n=1 Tax=Rubrivirga sp. TaxID=1885344 RepID=UPI003C76C208